jgi:hypothetical protein
VLMGGDENQFRQIIKDIAQSLVNTYKKNNT